jgi:hypothetical protein
MADLPGDLGVFLDTFLETVSSIMMALLTLIIGYILAYVAGEMVREVCCRIGRDRPAGISGLKPSVIAGKIAKALVFAFAAILAIGMLVDDGWFGEGRPFIEETGIRLVLGLLIMFIGAFLADVASSVVARWLHGGACISEETDPTKDLVFLGLIVSVVLVGLGIMLMDSPAVLLIYLAFLIIGVALILMETRHKMCRKI